MDVLYVVVFWIVTPCCDMTLSSPRRWWE